MREERRPWGLWLLSTLVWAVSSRGWSPWHVVSVGLLLLSLGLLMWCVRGGTGDE